MASFPSSRVPKVNLTKYVNLGNDQWRFCPVAVSANGRLRPDFIIVDGKPEKHEEGYYSLDWYQDGKRKRQTVGRSSIEAQIAQQRKSQVLRNKLLDIAMVEEKTPNSVRLADASEEFLREIKQRRRKKTYQQYDVALRYFEESSGGQKRLGEIDRKDVLNYQAFLKNEKKLEDRTISTKVNVVIQMLKANGISRLLRRGDWPKFVQTEPEIYTPEELKKFFRACTDWERTLFEFFVMTGFRDAEVQFATRKDLDLKQHVVRVTDKPQFGFMPKNWEHREVPIPDRLVESLKRHLHGLKVDSPFLFPTSGGQPDYHFLDHCKKIALRAGLNCGNCVTSQGSCRDKPVCEHWFLHKFRATFATMHLQAGFDLRTVQLWMGHKDLPSTMRYLKPARGQGVLKKVNQTFPELDPTAKRSPRRHHP